MGCFARIAIPCGTPLIEYVGERINKTESLRRCQEDNHYIFSLDEQWDLDGSVEWNPARLINHSCTPNCEAVLEDGRVWIISIRNIEPGEELSFNYGYSLEEYRDYPCRCGAPNCVGFIVAEEFFDQVRLNTSLRNS